MSESLERPGLADGLGLINTVTRYRELTIALALRELTVRYKRSVFGVGWALAEPAVVVLVYVLVFGRVLRADKGIENYMLFTLLGVAPWMFLSTALEQGTTTLIEHSPLIRKVYFPREILIGAVIFSRLTTLLLCLLLALGVGVVGVARGSTVDLSALPLVLAGLILITLMAYGLALLFASLNIVLRDTGFLVRFALRLGFYACPIVYPLNLVPPSVRELYELNPLVGILYCFQAIAGNGVEAPGIVGMASAVIGTFASLGTGVYAFRKLRSTVADLL